MSGHGCVANTDALLAEHNTRLAVAIDFSGKGRELIQIATAKADDKVRRKPIAMFASYCPFCGVKLNSVEPPHDRP